MRSALRRLAQEIPTIPKILGPLYHLQLFGRHRWHRFPVADLQQPGLRHVSGYPDLRAIPGGARPVGDIDGGDGTVPAQIPLGPRGTRRIA